jgi:hypothetical protein
VTSLSLLSVARKRPLQAVSLQPDADRHRAGRSRSSVFALGLIAPPLAHGSGGAPLWAVAVAIVVVAVALFLMFGPEWSHLSHRGSAEPGAESADGDAAPPRDSETHPGDQ